MEWGFHMNGDDSAEHFGKMDAKVVKGIAIFLMLAHHVWAFPTRTPIAYPIIAPIIPIAFNGREFFQAIGSFGKLCVGLYLFLGGYAYYKQYTGEQKYFLEKRIKNLYLKFWRIFFIFIPIAFLFFREQIPYAQEELYNRYEQFKLNTFILNLLGLSCSYNSEWWFLPTYVMALLFGTVYICWLNQKKNKNPYTEFLEVVFVIIFFCEVIPAFVSIDCFSSLKDDFLFQQFMMWDYYIGIFFMGILVARHNWAVAVMDYIKKRYHALGQIFISFVGILIIFYMRSFHFAGYMDMIYAPLFSIFALLILKLLKPLYCFFSFFGKHSANMWFIHSFYCYYFYKMVKIVYCSQNAIIDFLVLLCMSLFSSICVEWIYKYLGRGVKLLLHKKIKDS